MNKKIEKVIREKLINPILHSTAPVSQVSMGVAVGVFFGLTPTVGVQMYLVALIWSVSRYVFKKNFNLPVGAAMVWISNPLTMVPLYYLFLVTGYWILDTQNGISYQVFREHLNTISSQDGAWEIFLAGSRFLLIELGWPMVIGSSVFAFPGFLISYYLTENIVTKHRKNKALIAGIDYQEWRKKNETQH